MVWCHMRSLKVLELRHQEWESVSFSSYYWAVTIVMICEVSQFTQLLVVQWIASWLSSCKSKLA